MQQDFTLQRVLALKEGRRYEAVLFLSQTDQNSRAVSRHLQSLSEAGSATIDCSGAI